jgi:hypothetical protein
MQRKTGLQWSKHFQFLFCAYQANFLKKLSLDLYHNFYTFLLDDLLEPFILKFFCLDNF